MSSRERRWEQLQSRWASGEPLSADEERERLDYASLDPRARKELELFAELRNRAAREGEVVSPALIESVLDTVLARPRLRLVTSAERQPHASLAEPRPRQRQGLLLMVAALLVGAVIIAVRVVLPSAAPRAVTSASPTRPLASVSAAHATLVMVAGDVSVDGRRAMVDRGPLREGQRVTTRDGGACLTIASDIDVCLADNSAVRAQSLAANDIRLQVESGTALASLTGRAPGSSFSLLMDEVSASARGTTFAARLANRQREVIVLDGAVEVTREGDRPERVGASSRVLLRSDGRALERATVERGEAARLLELRSSHELWQTGSAAGVLDIFARPGALRASIDGQAPLPLPLQTVVRAGKRRLTWQGTAGVELTSSWLDVAAGERLRVEAPQPSVVSAARGEPDKPSPAALLDSARRELGRSRPGEALRLYERLRVMHPNSAEARTVLVTMGKLELKLGRHERALRHFDAYLRQGGVLAPEALAGKTRALRILGRHAEERDTMQQYLARYPRGLEAPLFEKRLRELGPP